MDLNKFTIKSQEAIQQAQQIATENEQQAIENGHILKGILDTDENVAPSIFKKLGLNPSVFEQALDSIVTSYPKVSGGDQYLSKDGNQSLQKALSYAKEFGDDFVSIDHMLLALVKAKDSVGQLMRDHGLSEDDLKTAIQDLRQGEKVTSASQEETYQALEKYANNLNEQAEQGKLDPVIGRDEEIRRVLQILSRRTKNNPVLIGDAGVGKTAIAEGMAHRVVRQDVPENLKDKKIYALDMGALLAGAKYKGEFEERLKSVVKEVTNSDGEVILFIDEIHTLVGAGGGEGAMDAANILKPALARGELHAIGATTLNEYQKHFEKDKALERRFQKVLIDEPDRDASITILRGIKEKYETHHKVQILDESIISAVDLSMRYITDRHLPDKAIDLIDEAASKVRMEINSKPEELDELERKMMQLEVEREAIKREGDTEKQEKLDQEIAELNDKKSDFMAKWQNEKDIVEGIQKAKEDIENLKLEAEQAERDGNYEKVAEIRYGKLKEAEETLKQKQQQLAELDPESKTIKEQVGSEEVAEVVSRWTGIPVSKMLQSEREKLLQLEDELHKRVVGQDEAIEAVSDAVRRSRSGLQDAHRPIGSFIFLGTTGVGKTELAKALSQFLFDDERNMTRIDMSEYQERHTVSRLVGSPPGYVGYEEGGQLTEAVRRKPYSVILLDEIEKAHHDVFNILLQVLDDGRLTDNKGRTVNFRNTIIIMTSNIGSDIIQANFEDYEEGKEESIIEQTKGQVMDIVKKTLRPEFLNRVDETIMFRPLTRKDMRKIVDLQLEDLQKRVEDQDIELQFSDEAREWLADAGYDPQYGARPVKRIIQKKVLDKLSKQILAGKIDKEKPVVLDAFEGEVVFREPVEE